MGRKMARKMPPDGALMKYFIIVSMLAALSAPAALAEYTAGAQSPIIVCGSHSVQIINGTTGAFVGIVADNVPFDEFPNIERQIDGGKLITSLSAVRADHRQSVLVTLKEGGGISAQLVSGAEYIWRETCRAL